MMDGKTEPKPTLSGEEAWLHMEAFLLRLHRINESVHNAKCVGRGCELFWMKQYRSNDDT